MAVLQQFYGGIIGIAFGSNVLSEVTFQAYATTFVLKTRLHVINYSAGIFAMLIAIMCTSFAAYLAVNKYLIKNAANLMRPKIEKKGKKTVFEKVKFIWTKLPFLTKVTLRNVFRYKGRMFMTILGVGGCTGLLFFGFYLRNSMAQTLPHQKEDITKTEYMISYNEIIDKDEVKQFKNFILNDDRIENSCEIYSEPLQYKDSRGYVSNILLIVPKDIESFNKQISLIDSRSDIEKIIEIPEYKKEVRKIEKNRLKSLRKEGKQDIIELNENEAIFTEKLLNIAGRNEGRDIYIQDLYGKEYKIRVGKPTKNYISHFVYMHPKYYDKIFNKVNTPNSYLIELKDNVDSEEFKNDILEYLVITSIVDMRFDEINSWVKSIDLVIIVLTAISTVLAFVVLYNLTYINISERIREISTIKVLGFYSKEVTRYIYSETGILTVLGILFGYLIGNWLYNIIVDFIVPDTLNLYKGITPAVYILSTAITLFFFVIVGIIIHKKLDKVDMIEALKGYE